MPQRPRVSVLGSLNTDISLPVPHLPGPGETVLAVAGAQVGAGGKGANQAVAAARLGAAARMAGAVGGDQFAGSLRAALAAEGVDVAGVRTVEGSASGLALITVDPAGENTIAVAPGANGRVGEREVAAAFDVPCDVLILSAEIPVPALVAALRQARARRVTAVLNLAPVPDGADALLAAGPDWLVVNAHEAAALLGRAVDGAAAAAALAPGLVSSKPSAAGALAPSPAAGTPLAAAGLASRDGAGARHVVITLGAAGAVLASPAGTATVPAFPVTAVDSVGAGDAFVGALAVALAAGIAPVDAVRGASAAGAAATTRRGAQSGLPRPADVLAATGLAWPVPG